MTVKKAGNAVAMGTIAVSADGKTRTVTLDSAAPDGKRTQAPPFCDKQ
jgi:hypothetical protein